MSQVLYYNNLQITREDTHMFKIIALSLLGAGFLWNLFLSILSYRARNNGIPEELNDVYDPESYEKWKKYSAENIVLDLVKNIVSFVIVFTLIITNVYSLIAGPIENIYTSAIVVLAVYIGIDTVVGFIFNYISDMKIEQKYGFNKKTMKTLIADSIKSLIISSALLFGLTCLFIVLYENMHDYILILFSGIMFVLVLIIMFLAPLFSKIFNKFTSLPEGELRSKLTAMLEKYGYQVRDIKVMDASRRTTKSNAYFTGFGKSKTIVLYDNLLKVMSDEEIIAIFAHEMGHGLHKDTLKNSFLSLLNIVIIVVLAWLLARFPEIYVDFGFAGLNYGFGLILLFECVMPIVTVLLGFISSAHSRRAEYRADEQAYKEGYADQLITALKKLTKENFGNLNPHPLVVLLHYSHPTLLQRYGHIQELKAK